MNPIIDTTEIILIVVVVVIFFAITAIALIYSSKKRGMEIELKKAFFKEKPEDIKNKILKEI